MRKKFIFSLILVFTLILSVGYFFAPKAESRAMPYYTGEAISFNNEVVFGTGGLRGAEIFKLEGDNIRRMQIILSDNPAERKIHDVVFNEEDGRLYVYLINGPYLFKYDITNLPQYTLVNKVTDNSKDYFYGLGKAGKYIMTAGTKNVKIWNTNLAVINAYNINKKNAKGIVFNSNSDFLFNTNNKVVQAIDAFYRNIILSVTLSVKEDHSMRPLVDEKKGIVYVVDDQSLKKIYIDGRYEEFKHISDIGYDVDASGNKDFVYFSDGIGVVKIRTSDMKPVNWAFTTGLGGENGWAMGLRVVKKSGRDVVIVFNGNSILAFDDRLELLDSFKSLDTADDRIPEIAPLSLSTDINYGWPGDNIRLEGMGFGSNEAVTIKFIDKEFYAQTDNNGKFLTTLTVPCIAPQSADLKVTGKISALTYSRSFEIK